MRKSIPVFALILVVGMGMSWQRYTSDEPEAKEGVVAMDLRKDDLQKIVYASAELEVTFEMKLDAIGPYGWVTVVEHKKKKGDDDVETITDTTSQFKAGPAADKLIEAFAPMYALRQLDTVDELKLRQFGLEKPEISVVVTAAGKETHFDIGGETYGTRDFYVRNNATGRVYVLNDEAIKPLKFGNSRLPERGLTSFKTETIDGVSLGQGSAIASWSQKNKDDRTAAYWVRDEGGARDETFTNFLGKAMKLKSTSYVQAADRPAELAPAFDFTLRVDGKPSETLRFQKGGDDWYVESEFTRGLVKLTRGPAGDAADEVLDIIEGRTPKETPKPEPEPPKIKEEPKRPERPPGEALDRPPRPSLPPMPAHPRPLMRPEPIKLPEIAPLPVPKK